MPQSEVYLVGVLEGCYKIGRSEDAERRLLQFAPRLPVTLTVHHRVTTDDASWLEDVLHTAFRHRRTLGEWFRLTGQDVALFRSLVAVRQGDQLLPDLLTLWRQNGGEAAMNIRPAPGLPPPVADPPNREPRAVRPCAREGETAVAPRDRFGKILPPPRFGTPLWYTVGKNSDLIWMPPEDERHCPAWMLLTPEREELAKLYGPPRPPAPPDPKPPAKGRKK